jgi:DNA polymerase-3 subunit delta'
VSSLLGQEAVLAGLENRLKSGDVPAGILIHAPRGSGKKTLAREIARFLNCEQRAPLGSECACNPCYKTRQGLHPDVRWHGIDEEASSVKIEEIHGLINWAGYKVLEGRWKVFVLVGSERMTEEAANALLKTLEEPPAQSVLILLAENSAKLLPTILSRCFKIKMRPLPHAFLKNLLVERYAWKETDAAFAARYSRGALGRALAVKDENFPEARGQFLRQILADPVRGLEAWAGKKRFEILRGLEFLTILLRDIAVWRETRDPALLYHEDGGPDYERWERLGRGAVLELMRLCGETYRAVEENVNPKIALFRLAVAMKEIHEKNLLSDDPALLR